MHKRTIDKIKSLEVEISRAKIFDDLQFILDDFTGNTIPNSTDISIQDNYLHVNIYVNHTNEIAPILTKLIKVAGKIDKRFVTPHDKRFNFEFRDFRGYDIELMTCLDVYFILQGDACKLVEVSSKEIITFKKTYRLECSNDKDGEITEEDIYPEEVSDDDI